MKLLKLSALALLSMGFFACGGSTTEESVEESLTNALNDIKEETSSTGMTTKSLNSYFDIDVPNNMTVMTDLNAEAALQYGYIEEVGSTVKEHYLIVLLETKEEIESYELDMEFDAKSYSDVAVEALRGGLDSYEILTKDAKVEKVNGLDCVKNEMRGSMGAVNVFYKLGVFEGENAFYQVLTWTIEEQKSEFSAAMDQIINSFKEK